MAPIAQKKALLNITELDFISKRMLNSSVITLFFPTPP